MAKNLALLALVLGIAALFLPMTQALGGAITVGVLTGTKTEPAGALFMAPQTFAALFGATLGRKRFGRGLGALHLIFGILGLLLCSVMFTEERKGVDLGLGVYACLASAAVVFIAGIVGLAKPDPKV